MADTRMDTGGSRLSSPVRGLLVVALLYLFLVGIRLLEAGIEGLGSDFTDRVFDSVSSPLAGLFAGILATVLVQSSSVTTATIVGLVATGVIDIDAAVPMIMGANIGTTVTNTIVALTHMRHSEEFRRAFTAATMHDWFNVLAVAILLPLELVTGFLSRSAAGIATWIAGGSNLGGSFDSPIRGAVAWGAGLVEDAAASVFGDGAVAAVVLLSAGLLTIFATLSFITRNMRILVADRIERSLNAVLRRSGATGILVGVIVTVAVQSSSITTSTLIPLVASGIILARNAYPITLGANIGTTITALLAALGAANVDGLTIALVHTLFNTVAIVLIWPVAAIRYSPVIIAERFASVAIRRRTLAVGYVFVAFVAIPLLGIVLL